MRILVGKTFGLGNACLSVPMIKALRSMGHLVDVIIGSTQDDAGAINVFLALKNNHVINDIHVDQVNFDVPAYDVAIMAIPYDGRWKNGVHYFATKVLDERKRPENVERLGLDMWKKHEVEYQMENARLLGFEGETPPGVFTHLADPKRDRDTVYIGIGYKRDAGGFGQTKHWGNERYAAFINKILEERPRTKFVSTGNIADIIQNAKPISFATNGRFHCEPQSLEESFETIRNCWAYFGNDTGMMHVAASVGIPTYAMIAYPDSAIKNPPFCNKWRMSEFGELWFTALDFINFAWPGE